MLSLLEGIRVDVAFAGPTAWVDLTSRVQLTSGITITRGRQSEVADIQPGTLALTIDNSDGALTPGRTSSPYYPYVRRGTPIRVSWRDKDLYGTANLLAAGDAGLEAGVGSWLAGYWGAEAPPTIAGSAVRAHSGAQSLLVTWPATVAGGTGAEVGIDLVIGRTYTARAWVYVPTGSPDVRLGDVFGWSGWSATTSVKNAWVALTVTWTAVTTTHYLGVTPVAATTAGTQVWVDDVQVDEGSALTAGFTTAAPVVSTRYTGYVSEWPLTWPDGVTSWATATVTAADSLRRLGATADLRSIVEEEISADTPVGYWPMGDQPGSTRAANVAPGSPAGGLVPTQVGAGGTITWQAGTGPGTDGISAPVLAPVDASNGVTFTVTARSPFNAGAWYPSGVTAETFVATSSTSRKILALTDDWGNALAVEVDATGKGVLRATAPWSSLTASATTAAVVATGATRHVAVTATSDPAGSVTTLYVDGVSVATLGTGAVWTYLPSFAKLTVAGSAGSVLAGTLAHVAVFGAALAAARVLAHAQSGLTGFAGERSDQRIARLARYVGVTSTTLDTGSATAIAFTDTTGQAPLSLMQQVAATEQGVLFVARDGTLTFHSRARRYNVTAAMTLDASLEQVDLTTVPDTDEFLVNDATVTRAGGGLAARVTSPASIAAYGRYRKDISTLASTDNDAADLAAWIVARSADPDPRLSGFVVDVLTQPALAAQLLALEISSMVQIVGLPAAAPWASTSVFVEGYTEQISVQGWTLTVTSSPASGAQVWQLGTAGLSELGYTTRLAF